MGDPRACPLKVDDELGLVPAWQAAALTLCLNCMQALPDLTVTANASAHSLTQHQNEHAVLSDLRPRFTGVAGCSKAPARNACAPHRVARGSSGCHAKHADMILDTTHLEHQCRTRLYLQWPAHGRASRQQQTDASLPGPELQTWSRLCLCTERTGRQILRHCPVKHRCEKVM